MIVVKEPSIIRTKKLYLPLSGNGYENKEPTVEGPVPAQVSDKKAAIKTIESTMEATKTIDTFNIGIFLLASLLSIGMATLWGSVRALQMIFITTMVKLQKPVNMTLFLTICVVFAQMDIFSAGDFFENHL